MRNLHLIKPGDVCAEVGVWKGEFSHYILQCKPSKLHLIDPWLHQDFPVDNPEDLRIYCCGQEEMDKIYDDVVSMFDHFQNTQIHRSFSIDVDFPENYFDWVYVDGNHSYENVLEDLWHYYKSMKSGGFLCGDDYGDNDEHDPYSNGGPKRAVKEFIEATGLSVEVQGTQFCIRIP